MKFSGVFTVAFLLSVLFGKAQENSIGIKMKAIEKGYFLMGSRGYGADFDEAPAHRVSFSKGFKMAETEITNAQYEQFDPEHRKWRGKNGLSEADDEAVIFVSYNQAIAFCKWLSAKEQKTYRLPTEAEWEYACRAGTYTAFSTGDGLPVTDQKNQQTTWDVKPVNLKVGKSAANAFGLYDMHGNVEEWCLDWYGPYQAGIQQDPSGPQTGLYRVTRGGSHSTPVQYLRSANRMAMIPEDKSWLVGFRIVEGDDPKRPVEKAASTPKKSAEGIYKWPVPVKQPVFMKPISFVNDLQKGDLKMYGHNHCPAITWCPNGDLLAVWFSTDDEAGREMAILGSRLVAGSSGWSKPYLFFKVPDRNMTGSSLFYNERNKTIYYMNGVEAAGSWQNLAMVSRTSQDNGFTWSAPKMAVAEHRKGNQVIAGLFSSKEGWLVQAADATPGGEGGSAIHLSKDDGLSWESPGKDAPTPDFKAGKTGRLIAGIHAGVLQLKNGDLMALGRGNNLIDPSDHLPKMPLSISKDMGKTWSYAASPFPPIAGGQRLVLKRLNQNAILLISFTNHPSAEHKGMTFIDKNKKPYIGYGLYAAVSFDEGKTWPIRKLITSGMPEFRYGGAWTGYFEMGPKQAEPRGYLAATQTPDQIIHLISSAIHYRFNLEWLETPADVYE